MISAVAWVPRGAAKELPKTAEPSPEELAALEQQLKEQEGFDDTEDEDAESGSGNASSMSEDAESGSEDDAADAAQAVAAAKAAAAALASSGGGGKGKKSKADVMQTDGIEDALRELDMDHYDDDDGDVGASLVQRALNGRADYHKGEDPYLRLGEAEDDADSELEDLQIKPTDLLILAAKSEDDLNNLEVWLYEEAETQEDGEPNMYVHHEIVLPGEPLCMAWTDCDPRAAAPTERGNLVAIGYMDETSIEIWDLDVLEAVEPVKVLGGINKEETTAKWEKELAEAIDKAGGKLDKKKKKKLQERFEPVYHKGSHTGVVRNKERKAAVLGLSWNRTVRNALASAGADGLVKVWDIPTGNMLLELSHHTEEVQAVLWNPLEPTLLLTGGFDKTVAVVDVRATIAAREKGQDLAPSIWQLPHRCEALAWCPYDPHVFVVSCEDGMVIAHDCRKGGGSAALWQLQAHDGATTSVSWCPAAAAHGLLATGGIDKTVKLWSVKDGRPSLLDKTTLEVGRVFTMGFSADAPHLLAVGGLSGTISMWDVCSSKGVVKHFPGLSPQQPPEA